MATVGGSGVRESVIGEPRPRESGLPLFYRLLRSYSLISVLPLASAWLVLAVWGDTLVAGYLRSVQERSLRDAVERTGEMIAHYQAVGSILAEDNTIRRAIATAPEDWSGTFELELYRRIYGAIAGKTGDVAIHVTDPDSRRVVSSTVYPERYRLNDYRNRRDFLTRDLVASDDIPSAEAMPRSRLFLNPQDDEEASRVIFALWFRTSHGYVIIDIPNSALWRTLDLSPSVLAYLVDRRDFRAYRLSQSGGAAGFTEHPELGIAFSRDRERRPTETLLVGRSDLPDHHISVVMTTDLSTYFETIDAIQRVGGLVVASLAVVIFLVSIRVSRSISTPIHEIVRAISEDPRGPRPLPPATYRHKGDELQRLMIHYDRMVTTLRELIQQVREEEKAQHIAERRALESQIQPHFLYNTLGSIKSMAKLGDISAVTTMVTDLGKMMRFLLSDASAMVPLEASIEQNRRYLNIHKVRFQDRMRFSIDLAPATRRIPVPKLLIQPLVENAILHGVEVSTEPVEIRIRSRIDDDALEIQVIDTGPGPRSPRREPSEEGGIGLQNVRERLHLFYGEAASLTLVRTDGATTATIRIGR
jgi:two-component system sensor histidine kinase YesM